MLRSWHYRIATSCACRYFRVLRWRPLLPKTADIEDLLDLADYLRLYNWAFSKNLDVAVLGTTSEPIIRQVSKIEGEFDHALPAHALTEHREEFYGVFI